MTTPQLTSAIVALSVTVFLAHVLGHVFERFRQPRLIGEILAGVLIGPFVLGRVGPNWSRALTGVEGDTTRIVLGFSYWLGLLLLMFTAGSEVQRVLGRENRRPTAWLLGVGTTLPFFLALVLGSAFPLERLAGAARQREAVLLVFASAVAITSIPVISRIFHDLGILNTRFASLILGTALFEDIALWAVLAVASAIASTTRYASLESDVPAHIGLTIGFTLAGLVLAPALLRKLHVARWNVIARESPVAYALLVLLGYATVAALLGLNLVFAAFLAGFALVGGQHASERVRFGPPLESLRRVAFAVFVPTYFAVVGTQIELGREFSPALLLAFLLGSSLLCFCSVGLAARLAGFRGIEIVNIAVVSNARGGPGIVLASVAREAGIINGAFFSTLVLTAILTSQLAGWWLQLVIRKGWPLLRGEVVSPASSAAHADGAASESALRGAVFGTAELPLRSERQPGV